jgi:hypothetical protein
MSRFKQSAAGQKRTSCRKAGTEEDVARNLLLKQGKIVSEVTWKIDERELGVFVAEI